MERLYKIREAAELLKVTRKTIYNWRDSGKLKFVRVNGHPRIKESELKNLVKEEK